MKFLVDNMLGKLAKRLRLLGFDTLYEKEHNLETLFQKSLKENRILLSRDRKLYEFLKKKPEKIKYILIEEFITDEQLKEIIKKLNIKIDDSLLFTRCSLCNNILKPVEKNNVQDKLPPKVFQYHNRFWVCDICKKYYWEGTHINNLKKIISSCFLLCVLLILSCNKKNTISNFIKVGNKIIQVEIADTVSKRAMGLMFRDSLCDDCGMLFIFEKPEVQNFWMKNTKIPLSIAFINESLIIVKIEDMVPFDEINLHSSEVPVLYALEMNKDWFLKNNIKVGDKIILHTK